MYVYIHTYMYVQWRLNQLDQLEFDFFDHTFYPFLYFLLFFAWFYFNGVYMRVGIIMNPFNRLFLCIKRPFTIGDSNQHVGHLGPILILGYKNQSCFALNIHCIVANFKKNWKKKLAQMTNILKEKKESKCTNR